MPSKLSLDRDFAKGVLWTGAAKWFIQLISWPATIVTAKLLIPGDYGYVALVAVVMRFVQLFTEAGIGAAIVSGISVDEDQLRQLNSLSLILGAIGFIATGLLSWPVSWFYHDPSLKSVLIALAVVLLLEGAALVPAAELRRRLDFRQLAVCEAARNVTDISVTLLLAYLGAKYWSLIIGSICGVAVWLGFTRWAAPIGFAAPSRQRLGLLVRFSRHLIGRNVAGFVASGSDTVIGGATVGKVGLGHYSFGLSIAWAPAEKITQLIVRVAPAVFGRVRDDRAALARYFVWVTGLVTMIAYPMFAGIAIVAEDVIPLLLGANWTGLVPVILPFCLGGMAAETVSLAPHLLVATGRTRVLAWNAVASMLTMPALYFILSRRWGAAGLATAWALGAAILSLPTLIVACRQVGVSFSGFLRALYAPLLATALMSLGLLTLRRNLFVDLSPIFRTITTVAVGPLIYFTLLMLFDGHRIRTLIRFAVEWRRGTPEVAVGQA
jgi:O-antigen/teichoic acid export membrane protein